MQLRVPTTRRAFLATAAAALWPRPLPAAPARGVHVTTTDQRTWHEFSPFLPDRLFDVHVHPAWPELLKDAPADRRDWPDRLAWDYAMPFEDLRAHLSTLYPGKTTGALAFAMPFAVNRTEGLNERVAQGLASTGLKGLVVVRPTDSRDTIEKHLANKVFVGLKPHFEFVRKDRKAMTVGDFVTDVHLQVAHEGKRVVMLHLPPAGPGLLNRDSAAWVRDTVRKYPGAKLVLAQMAMLHCPKDAQAGLEAIRDLPSVSVETSGTSNPGVARIFLDALGPDRILYGTDMPVGLMKARTICQEGRRIFRFGQPNPGEAALLPDTDPGATFLAYEIIRAHLNAIRVRRLGRAATTAIFWGNAQRLMAG